MRLIKYFSLFAILFTLTSSCKKYPDGPCISFRSKSKRIEGNWFVETYLINGDDSTAEFNPPQPNGLNITYYFEGSKNNEILGGNLTGHWEFRDDKKSIYIEVSENPSLFPNLPNIFIKSLPNGASTWAIRRLTHKEFWIKSEMNSKTYEIKFAK